MATDIQKFLDQAGVTTLWSLIVAEVQKTDDKVVANANDISTLKTKVETLEQGTYDDSEIRSLIAANTTAISEAQADADVNAAAIAVLNGTGDGSVSATVAAKIAEVVAGADASFDTLKEIADWILNDETGAADMANDITELQTLVGSESVATQIANAIAAEGLDKYALAADLTTLADRVSAVETAKHTHNNKALLDTYTQTEVDLADAVAKKHEHANKATLDAITATKVSAWDNAEANANAYTDTVFAKIQPLTTEEINAAIAAATTA